MTDKPKLQVTCPRCSQKFSIDLPPPEISNNFRTSTVSVAHERPVRCSNNKCRAPFQLIVAGAQCIFNAVALDDKTAEDLEGTKIIKPSLELVGGLQ